MISVTGMGGMGKTTLVKKVFDDPEVRKHFKACVWVTVSQSCKTEEQSEEKKLEESQGIARDAAIVG